MKIKQAELFHIRIPCAHPFETSFGVIDYRPALIIRLTSDYGLVGYGESSPLDVPMSEQETTAGAVVMLKEKFPTLIGLPVEEGFDIVDLYSDLRYPVSLFGIEGAYLDLVAQMKGIPLHRLFGATHSQVIAGESVGLQPSIDMLLEAVESHVRAGFPRIKIKITQGRDIKIVQAVRNVFPSLCLGVDANSAYTSEDVAYLANLAKYNLAFVEQPFQADDYKSHATLRQAGIRICLDETIRNLPTCERAVKEKACDVINIKPARIGSFKESRRIYDFCVREGINLFGGGRLETGIGKTSNAAFYALPGFTEASDITPPQDYLESDIITPPFRVKDGVCTLSDLPGLGITVDEKNLKRFSVEHYVFPM